MEKTVEGAYRGCFYQFGYDAFKAVTEYFEVDIERKIQDLIDKIISEKE